MIALLEEKSYHTRDLLKQIYPMLPEDIIDQAVKTSEWHILFAGTNRYNIQVALDNFYNMTLNIIKERQLNSFSVIQIFLLDKKRCLSGKETDTDLVKGLRSIPEGVLLMILKSVQNVWSPHVTNFF
jgi:hypothetical protein